MEDNVRIFLLKIIKYGGDVSPFVDMGYTYSQVAQFIKEEIATGNASKINGSLGVTEQGEQLINSINKTLKRGNSSAWIEPELGSKIPNISVNDIFLPNQDELSF